MQRSVEFDSPAAFSISNNASAVDCVFDYEVTDPDLVVFKRMAGDTWTDVTAAEFGAAVAGIARGLVAAGLEPGQRVALMSGTRYEWPLIDYAIWAAGGVTVPIYETSAPEQIQWILEDSGATLLVIETQGHRDALKSIEATTPALDRVFQIEAGAVAELVELGSSVDIDVVRERTATLSSDSPATLIYTSGTTGRPKGCVLTHSNLLFETAADLASGFDSLLRPGKTSLMFLPMAHVFARAVSLAAVQAKVTIGHTSDTKHLATHLQSFKPNFVVAVPRVFEKVYNSARQKAYDEGKLKGKIFDAAAETAIAWSTQLGQEPGRLLRVKQTVFDRLVFAKLRAALGGRCEAAISGGAPLGARLGHFFRGSGVAIYEGYGLTETTGGFTVNAPGACKIGTVGKALPGNAVRIADDGELQLQGGVVFDGYWHNEAATEAAFEREWFHTGDLGEVDDEGYVTITGRMKDIIVTAGGKNVAPAGLEDRLRAHALISQAMVVGDQKPFIGALVTIDPDAFPRWKSENGKSVAATVADLVLDADLRSEIDSAVRDANSSVSNAEAIKKFRVLSVDFTEETGELTPTLKVKRNVVYKNFAKDIEAIYN